MQAGFFSPNVDILNDKQLPMIIGLSQLQIDAPTELVVNNQGSYIIVANEQTLQILKSYVDFGGMNDEMPGEPKIVLESMCTLNLDSLPVQVSLAHLDQIIFNHYEGNTFYVLGRSNQGFDQADQAQGQNSMAAA